RRQREQSLPELAPLRAALGEVIRAERVIRRPGANLATVYHLIPRETAREYADLIARAAPRLAPLRVVTSGPWPAYGFAPDAPTPRPRTGARGVGAPHPRGDRPPGRRGSGRRAPGPRRSGGRGGPATLGR